MMCHGRCRSPGGANESIQTAGEEVTGSLGTVYVRSAKELSFIHGIESTLLLCRDVPGTRREESHGVENGKDHDAD